MTSTDLPASAFADCGHPWCGTRIDSHNASEHCPGAVTRSNRCWCPACWARRSRKEPPDTTLVKSTRTATCAVCREVVTGSIELPTGEHVCGKCCCIALRNMIDDAAACRVAGKPIREIR